MSQIPYVFPRIELRGEPFAIGKRYGQLTRERVLLHLLNQKILMARLRPEDPDWWRSRVRNYLPLFEEMAPYFVEEMEGLARGADLTIDEVLLINVRCELLSSLKPESIGDCTSFGCNGDVTLSGHPILGQTKDTGPISADLFVITAMYQQGRPDLLQLAYAGEFGGFGLSSSGMATFGNSLYVAGKPQGRIAGSLASRLTLHANSVDEVLALVERHGRAEEGNSLVGDRTGRVVCIETADHGYGVVEAENGILAHANHINTPGLQRYETYPEPGYSGSLHRQARLTELLQAERGRLTPTLAMRCLMDHTNYPRSICRHASPGDSDAHTTAAMVVEPTLGLLHAIRGQPCQNWPVTYSL